MVPKDFRKGQCVLAGWFTLLVGIVWEIIAIYIVGVLYCTWDFVGIRDQQVTVWNMLYVTYFMGGCREVSSSGFDFTPPSLPADNLLIWMWIYLVVTAVWIVTSAILLAAAFGEVQGRRGAILYYPWLCLTLLLIVFDFASTIYYLVDLFHSLDFDSYAELTDNTDWSTLTEGASKDGITPWLPSLYISLICCRFLILWIINCICAYIVFKASRAVSLYKTRQLQQPTMTHEKIQRPQLENDDHQSIQAVSKPEPNISNVTKSPPRSPATQPEVRKPRGEHRHSQYIEDPFGIPIEVVDPFDPREISYSESEGYLPRTPYQPEHEFDFDHQDNAPPIASGVQVPPELNNFQPFSYMAGDQPQQLRRNSVRNLSRSNSRVEYPHIPRPDYTIADRNAHRHSTSLEYIPNRFKVPQQRSFLPSQSSFNDSLPSSPHSPISPRKVAPLPLHKPQPYPKTPRPPEDLGVRTPPHLVHLPQQSMPGQPPTYYNRQTSQGSNYSISKLY